MEARIKLILYHSHSKCVEALNKKAEDWGLEVTELQILEILPADDVYLATIRDLGSQ